MARFAISSWSVDGLLQSGLPLTELPGACARRGIRTLELCHFHLPTTDSGYLQGLRQTLEAAEITLSKLLIDTGDLAAPDPARRAHDLQGILGWTDVAARLGAQAVRVDAGHGPPTPEAIDLSVEGLLECARYAARHGLRTVTENWHATAQEATALLEILERCGGEVGLCADTGNADATPDKYGTLAQLLPYASSVHFKARYTGRGKAGEIDMADLERCAQLLGGAAFGGVVTLIYAEKVDEWAGIEALRGALEPYLAP